MSRNPVILSVSGDILFTFQELCKGLGEEEEMVCHLLVRKVGGAFA
jgi:hypothetical protein